MRLHRRFLTTLTAVTVLGAAAGHAQAPAAGTVTGRALNATTEQPLQGAAVVLVGTSIGQLTDGSGHFRLDGVEPGVYTLVVRAIGFRQFLQGNVVVGSGKPYEVEVRLEPIPITLEGVTVRPSYFRVPDQAVTSTRTLGAEGIRRAPGVQEDVVRAVALLPGVAVTGAGRNDLIVRGGAPFENLFVVDGIEVPNINHFGSQGSTGGPLSLINIEFVQEADFSAGGFGARYGDRTASLTNIVLREGSDERLSGELNLSATGFGAIAEGPLGRGSTFLFSARRSYLDLLFKAAGFSFVPAYWDFQLKTTHRLDPANTVSLLAIGALDDVTFFADDADDRFDNSRVLSPEQRQYFAGLRWLHFLPRGVVTTTLGRTYTRFRSVQLDSLVPPGEVFRGFSDEGETSLRLDLRIDPARRLELNAGWVGRLASDLAYDVALAGEVRIDSVGQPAPLAVDTSFTAFRQAVYGEVAYRPTAALRLSLGARLDHYAFLNGVVRAAPRLGFRLAFGAASAVTASVGRYHQAPSYVWLVGAAGNGERLVPIEADQIVLGYERELRVDTKLQVELYAKRYRSYPARLFRPQAVLAPSGFEDATTDVPFGLEPLASRATGRAYGVELFLQKR
ncbi:MAG: TonB-dependent receptor, partial [Gemmatimonadales bacterium]